MATNKKPRRPYKPKWAKVNPIELVADRIKPVEKQGSWALDRRLKQSAALAAIMQGEAAQEHISDLLAMHNMTVALQKHRVGSEYSDVTERSHAALTSILDRYRKLGRYGATGVELSTLKELYELHDAQLEASTVGEVNRAYEYATRVRRGARLPTLFAAR